MRRTLISMAVSLAAGNAPAQPQHYNWYFGFQAGLSFAGGVPSALTNGALSTDEGVAAISDSAGQLLFYTNGEVVYNRLHQPMPNGSGLWGSFTTAQSALIVPFPDSDGMYYVFTQAAQAGFAFPGSGFGGLAYSVVDGSLDGGNGDVTVKNMALTDTTCESLCAVRHANGSDAWVLTHKWGSDVFHAYRVDCQGVHTNPVLSAAGRVHDDTTPYHNGAIGCMKGSPDGRTVAIAWTQFFGEPSSHARVDVFRFDNGTGRLTLRDSLVFDTASTIIGRGYGVAFSPSGRYLYCSTHGLNGGIAYSEVYQVDLEETDLDGTKTIVANALQAFGSLQPGPDGKLYMARLNGAQFLSALNFPDSAGAASQFVASAVSLNGQFSTWGLPNNWNQFASPASVNLVALSDTILCAGEPVTLAASLPFGDTSYAFIWSTGSTAQQITVEQPGMYSVTAYTACDSVFDHVVVDAYGCACEIRLPNVVTANGDGLNDRFRIGTVHCMFESFSLDVFNRWGNRMLHTTQPDFEWMPPAAGAYFCIVTYTLEGNPGKRESLRGFIQAIQ